MLTLTDAAGAHLSGLLGEVEAPDEAAVRIVLQDQGLALRLDQEQPGDKTFEHNGKKVLLLDEQVSNVLAEKTLDVEDSESGPRLSVT